MHLVTPIRVATAPHAERRFLRRAPLGPLMLATDCGAASDAAVIVVSELSRFTGASVEVLSVQPPDYFSLPTIEPGIISPSAPAHGDPAWLERLERRRLEAREHIMAACGEAKPWPLDVLSGSPALVITGEARRRNPALLVMGLRRHDALDRFLGAETTLRVVRHSPVPVLGVTPTLTGLPRRAVVGVDFSRASLHTARAALDLMPADGSLILVHVQPHPDPAEHLEGLGVVYAQGVVSSFARFRAELEHPPQTSVATVLLEGDASHELLAFAERAGADLIAVGSHRHSLYERVVGGTVTTALIRDPRCSVLVWPANQAAPPA